MAILRQLVMESQERGATGENYPILKTGDLLLYFVFALNRFKTPFRGLINVTCVGSPIIEHFGLQESGLQPNMVSAQLANNITGPTFDYGHVVCHPLLQGSFDHS